MFFLFRQGTVGYSLINGLIPAMTQQQILLKEEGFFNVGVDLGLFELTTASIEFGRLYTT